MKYLVVAVLCLLGCQQSGVEGKRYRTIHVVGIGKVKTLPDQVEITIKAEFTKPRMKDAVSETQSTIDEVLKVANKYVKEATDIKTSSISANKDYEWTGTSQVFKGYQASQAVDITLKDISQFEKFTEEILATRISGIENLTFSNSKADSILREVDLLAIDDAYNSAGKICERTKVKLGKVLNISNYGPDDGENEVGGPRRGRVTTNLYGKGFGGRGFQLSPEIMVYTKTAFITFEIE